VTVVPAEVDDDLAALFVDMHYLDPSVEDDREARRKALACMLSALKTGRVTL
jgi:hypothetical protein